MNLRSKALAVGLGFAIVGATAAPFAYADELSDAQDRLTSLGSTMAQLQEELQTNSADLENTKGLIDQTQADIAAKQEELKNDQAILADRTRTNYKSGSSTIVDVLLASSNFDDLVNRVYYMDKVSSSDAATINEVKALKQQLDDQEANLEQQESQQQDALDNSQAKVSEYQAKVSEAQSYYNTLSAEVRQQLAEQAAAATTTNDNGVLTDNVAVAVTAAATDTNANANTDTNTNTNTDNGTAGNTDSTDNGGSSNTDNGGSSSNSGSGDTGYVDNNGGGGLSSSQRSAILAAAQSKLGCEYVYGDAGPSTFDCSGYTQWCYAHAGISLPHNSGAQSAMCSLKSVSSCEAGDLIFWSGHVAIYDGAGGIYEAANPGVGVVHRAIWGSPYGGGTPV
ncbi:MAG: NlpC/P60 family protein [Atopobiaceae bacterium]|jgi:peptidoglycan hydrolase CwlO-like protein